MKLVVVTERLPYGGHEAFLIPELKELQRQGHAIVVVPLVAAGRIGHGDAAFLRAHTSAIRLSSLATLARLVAETLQRPRTSARLFWRAARTGRLSQRILNCRAIAVALLVRASLANARVDHVHAYWANAEATAAQAIAELLGVPWSFTAHRYDIVANNGLAAKLRGAAFSRFISESGLALLERATGVRPSRTARFLRLGVEMPPDGGAALLHGDAEGAAADTPPVMVCPAALVPVKGHEFLLQALALLRDRGVDCTLWLAGEGELRKALEDRARHLGIADRALFLGRRSHDEVLGWYAGGAVACVVLPSLDLGGGLHEGLPIALVEAMGHGIPVVSTTTGGIPELLGDGAGVLVPPGDAAALADALAGVLADRPAASRLGAAGRARAMTQHDVSAVVAEFVELLQPRRA